VVAPYCPGPLRGTSSLVSRESVEVVVVRQDCPPRINGERAIDQSVISMYCSSWVKWVPGILSAATARTLPKRGACPHQANGRAPAEWAPIFEPLETARRGHPSRPRNRSLIPPHIGRASLDMFAFPKRRCFRAKSRKQDRPSGPCRWLLRIRLDFSPVVGSREVHPPSQKSKSQDAISAKKPNRNKSCAPVLDIIHSIHVSIPGAGGGIRVNNVCCVHGCSQDGNILADRLAGELPRSRCVGPNFRPFSMNKIRNRP